MSTVPSAPWGGAVPPAAAAPGPWTTKSPPEADLPRLYPQLLRGPKYAPWRGVLAILMASACGAVAAVVISIIAFAVVWLTGQLDVMATSDVEDLTTQLYDNPVIFLANNLALAALIPIAGLTVWACFGWRPRWVSSVAPGIRWTWLVVSFLICLPFHIAVMAWSMWGQDTTWTVDGQAVTLVVIVLLTTPLQAAGEEYLFRGVFTQAIGSWFARPLAAVLVSALVSGLGFAALHSVGGEQDVWLFLGRFCVGLLFSYLVWVTGGLEAAVSAHAVNNMVIMIPMALSGGLGAAVTASEGSPVSLLVDVVVMVIIGAVITVVAKRMGLQREHDPAAQPGGRRPAMTDCWPDLPGPGVHPGQVSSQFSAQPWTDQGAQPGQVPPWPSAQPWTGPDVPPSGPGLPDPPRR